LTVAVDVVEELDDEDVLAVDEVTELTVMIAP
jgi:hypothetical protein